jgi:putative transposase
MKQDTVVDFRNPSAFSDALTEVLRAGAQQMIQQAVEAELEAFLSVQPRLPDGRMSVTRNGRMPEREVLTGIGPIPVQMPKTRDRSGQGRTFRSSLVPPYVRKAASVEAALPWLYLSGISANGMQEALQTLLGDAARGLSDTTVGRLKSKWQAEFDAFSQTSFHKDQWIYLWADGIYSGLRSDGSESVCALVVIGVNERGQKKLLGLRAGRRESTASWKELFVDLQKRGVKAPKLIIGDGAAGLWAAADQVFPGAEHQRCWVHKTANVLNKLPKNKQAVAKQHLHAIWNAGSRKHAEKEFDRFTAIYEEKWPDTVQTLRKDREALLTFYRYPAKQWKSLRTTNPIESTFATVRHRTTRSKGAFSEASIMALKFKLIQAAEKRWQRIAGFEYLAKVISGVKFADGIEIKQNSNTQRQSLAA